MEAIYHTPRERKSKSLDKGCLVEREKERKKEKKRKKMKERAKREKGKSFLLVYGSCLQEESRRGKEK